MSNLNEAKTLLNSLIDRYKKLKETGSIKQYDEANTCKDFILPLFELLGWNVYDRAEVTAQAQASKGKVDYAFCIQGIPKFFLEAKALKADLDNPRWAEQTINYAWHKGVVWAVLSDFEALKVFNAELLTTSPQESLLFELKWMDYVDRFDQLYLLSKEALLENRLDQEAERWHKKKTKIPVNERLLQDMMTWRRLLATSIRRSHPKLSDEELDEAIQRILDRLIFIRTCEDRGIEPAVLQPIIREWRSNLKKIFRNFDSGYNSQIFAPHLCEDLSIETEVLEEIINGLYETKDRSIRYDFSAIDADVLGSMYEQYLGHILKKTPKRAIVHEKHQHRKEMGIYYTPKYIVDYIVKNTVGALLKEKSYQEAVNLKILDPACGSGSFLIRAFEEMDSYLKEKRSQKGEEFDYFRRMEILNRNLYGVDLDRQAVEIAQLNLLIKAVEGRQLLPVLKNIRQGNSLISGDEDELKKYFGKDWQQKHPFNWEKEFPEVFKDGGFDVVIGNPPYVRQEGLGDDKDFFENLYQVYAGTADLYSYFIERGMNLLREGGVYGIIVANKWLRANYGAPLRRWLKGWRVKEIVDFGDLPVFESATTYPCLLFVTKAKPIKEFVSAKIDTLGFNDLGEYISKKRYKVDQSTLSDKGWSLADSTTDNLLSKLKSTGIPLVEYVKGKIYRGILTGLNKAFVIDAETRNRLIKEDPKSKELIKPFLVGADIKRYETLSPERFLIFARRGINIKQYPAVERYLSNFRKQLTPMPKNWDEKKSGKWQGRKPGAYEWYEIQDTIGYYEEFEKNKIIYPNICKRPEFTFDNFGFYTNQKCFIIPEADKYLLGLLNSSVTFFLFRSILPKLRGDFYEPSYVYFKDFPIRTIDLNNKDDKAIHDRFVKLVDSMLDLNKQLQKTTPNTDRWHSLKKEIEKTDTAIDQAVYDLYSITDEERKIIEQTCSTEDHLEETLR